MACSRCAFWMRLAQSWHSLLRCSRRCATSCGNSWSSTWRSSVGKSAETPSVTVESSSMVILPAATSSWSLSCRGLSLIPPRTRPSAGGAGQAQTQPVVGAVPVGEGLLDVVDAGAGVAGHDAHTTAGLLEQLDDDLAGAGEPHDVTRHLRHGGGDDG